MSDRLLGASMLAAFVALVSHAAAQVPAFDPQSHHRHQHAAPRPPLPAEPKAGDQVSFCGTVVALVEDGCIGIVGATKTYEMTSVTPKPPIGATISGAGVVSEAANICMQGLHLGSATWKPATSCGDGP